MEELATCTFDAVIVGAGPAGCTMAAALSALGKRTLLVDAGGDRKKMLSGELIHPDGVAGLAELGFGSALADAGALSVSGFVVFEPDCPPTHLAYASLGQGVSLEHAAILGGVQQVVANRPGVTFWSPARATEVVEHNAAGVRIRINHGDTPEVVRAQVLIVATGRAGALRDQIGITETHAKVSTMLGLRVDVSLLPSPGKGHVFSDGHAPILAYAITPDVARVLVDVPLSVDWHDFLTDEAWPLAVPEPLHSAIRHALATEKPSFASNDVRVPDAVVRGRIALVGDAAGCCHPVSVSGISSAVRDALAITNAMRDTPDDVPGALRAYAHVRRSPQRTRIALASALYRAFAEPSREMELLRRGMRRYWGASVSNQQASLALLAGRNVRMSALAKEYGAVVTYALVDASRSAIAEPGGITAELTSAARLLGSVVPHARNALAGAIDELRPSNTKSG